MEHETVDARLEAFLNTFVDPILITDAAGVLTFVNHAAREQFGSDKRLGVALAERMAQIRLSTVDGARLAHADHPVTRAIATGAPVVGVRLLAEVGPGAHRAYASNTVPLRDGDRLVGTLSVLRDITEEVRLERDLADHTARLQAIVELVSDAVYVLDLQGRILFANAVGRRLLPAAPSVGLEERMRGLRPRRPDGRPLRSYELPAARALRGEDLSGMEFVATTESGERRMVAGAHPLRRPDGTIYAAVVTWKDITEDVRVREEAETAREAAEEANRLKDQFIAALSHELRAPLQPILGWTEALRRHRNLDAVTTQALDAIRRNVRQQVRIVDDLLDLSRIMHGKFTLRLESFDLREQVRAAAEPFVETAALKRVRLRIDLPAGPMLMWGDGARVQQIATNLISNAVKFTPAGGSIVVRLIDGEAEWIIEVEDSGEGIDPEELPIIFQVFRQAGRGGRRGGLGIGLDLVKRLTELHGGAVEAFSDGLGYGARFQVRFPSARGVVPPPAPAAKATGRLDRRSILIVEDSDDTREVLGFMLQMEGAKVATAESGQEGLRAAEAVQPDVILCDIGLPDIDGMEVARRIRRQARGGRTRLIALTGYGQAEDIRQALEAGFEAHLTKPINLDQLLDLLEREPTHPAASTVDRGPTPQVE